MALSIVCTRPIRPSLPLVNPGTTDLFTVSIVLPFAEGRVLGITRYEEFSDRLLSLNTHLRFLHLFMAWELISF